MGAIFLIGLIVGVVSGIGMFFAHLMWHKKEVAEDTQELDLLLEEIALSEEDDFNVFDEDSMVDEKAERSDPWERPADWWMNADED